MSSSKGSIVFYDQLTLICYNRREAVMGRDTGSYSVKNARCSSGAPLWTREGSRSRLHALEPDDLGRFWTQAHVKPRLPYCGDTILITEYGAGRQNVVMCQAIGVSIWGWTGISTTLKGDPSETIENRVSAFETWGRKKKT